MARVEIVKWGEFQHYAKRLPPWIKLHRRLLNNRKWIEMPAETAKLLVELWLIAAETNAGVIELNTEDLAFRVRRGAREVAIALIYLQEKEFVNLVDHDASAMLATCYHRDRERAEGEQRSSVLPLTTFATEPAAPNGKQSGETNQQRAMGAIRKHGFNCDKTDASVVKALLGKGIKPEAFEPMAGGMRILCDAGQFSRMERPVHPGGKLSMLLVYAAGRKDGQLPLWRKAEQAYYEAQKRGGPKGLRSVSSILGIAN